MLISLYPKLLLKIVLLYKLLKLLRGFQYFGKGKLIFKLSNKNRANPP